MKKEKIINLLDFFDITINNYSQFRYYDMKLRYTRLIELAHIVYKDIIKEEDYNKILKIFGNNKKKTKIALIDVIIKYISTTLSDVTICAEYYSSEYKYIYIWTRYNFTVSYIVKHLPYIRNNLNFRIFYFSEFLIKIFLICIKYFFNKLKVFFIKTNINKSSVNNNNLNKDKNNYKEIFDSEILFFPHYGISYGNLFEKDYYYNESINSNFNSKKITHIEYGVYIGSGEYKNIKEQYEEKKYKYFFIPKKELFSILKYFLEFLKLLSVKFILFRFNALILYSSLYIIYKHYSFSMSKFRNSKIALVGFDFLFPKALTLVLEKKNIKTIAIQERFLAGFLDYCYLSIDYYLVWGEKVKEKLNSSQISYCKEIKCIEPPRLKFLKRKETNVYNKYKNIKEKYSKLVVAFDFHSTPNKINNLIEPVTNYDNNAVFYKSIIKLALKFPDVCFVIRGKNDAWCNIDYFGDIIEIIDNIDNLIIDHNYNINETASYQILSLSDLVVARHTSICDEALISDIPVIFHDFGANFKKGFSTLYDYEEYVGFVFSDDELIKKTKKFLFSSKKYYLDKKDIIFSSNDKIYNLNEYLENKLKEV